MKKIVKVAALFAVSVMLLGACSNNAGGGSGGGTGGTGGTVTKSLTSITVSQRYTGDYIVNDTITDEDIEVTAFYSDNTTKAVTGWTTDEDFSAVATNKTITISYTEDGITQTDTITINIVDAYNITYTFTTAATNLPTNTDGTAGASATYVEFGDWPQTIKAPLVRIDESTTETRGMFTYYAGSDGNWYCKVQENAYVTDTQHTYTDGTPVAQSFANSYKYFKVEPIVWRVVTTQYKDASTSPTDKKLLVAESGLMANVPYDDNTNDRTINIGGSDTTVYQNNYEHSKIRAWLNGLAYNKSGTNSDEHKDKGFLQTAFGSDIAVLAKIAGTVVDNSAASTGYTSNSYVCDNTNDKVFLLSRTEATTNAYFANDNARIRKPTDFALANYAYLNGTAGYGSSWWLRSPYYDFSSYARFVDFGGYAGYNSYVNFMYVVVVPALSLAP